MNVAALYVQKGGAYWGLPGVDCWDEARDARTYAGPWPVVAHPPCQRWGKLWAGQPLWIKTTGERKRKGDDAGCFAAALAAVRKFGGVLEHPEGSHAWKAFDLIEPSRHGAWIVADWEGGWTCCIEQGQYGHYARKPTWLYANKVELPSLKWGKRSPSPPPVCSPWPTRHHAHGPPRNRPAIAPGSFGRRNPATSNGGYAGSRSGAGRASWTCGRL